jgi:cell division ATPase FtsA
VVLTGGAVLLPGVCELAEEILGMPVRVAMPTAIKGITQLVHGPEFSTGVGLVKFGAQIIAEGTPQPGVGSVPPPAARGRALSREDIGEPRKSGFWDWIKAAF